MNPKPNNPYPGKRSKGTYQLKEGFPYFQEPCFVKWSIILSISGPIKHEEMVANNKTLLLILNCLKSITWNKIQINIIALIAGVQVFFQLTIILAIFNVIIKFNKNICEKNLVSIYTYNKK